MGPLATVFLKEFLENLRDRRTLISALLFGPLFGPILFGAMVSRMLDQSLIDADQPLEMTIAGSAYAPTLVRYLESHAVKLSRSELTQAAARAAVSGGHSGLILIVPPEYPARFAAGAPAAVFLVADSADSEVKKNVDRARALLSRFGSEIAQLRLQVRGIDPLLTVPIAVNEIDTATPTGRSVAILGFMTYFVLFAMLMGGLYLAIDSTAGERERGSLEALLSLPVARSSLVGGKILATCAYMTISLAMTLSALILVFGFVPLEKIGMSSNLRPPAGLALFALCLPLVPLGAVLLTFVASFTRSYREAQTYLTAVLLIPTLPIAFASIYSLKTKTALMFVPSLSQHLLMTAVLRGETPAGLDVAISALVSIALAALLFAFTARHWRRESMLG